MYQDGLSEKDPEQSSPEAVVGRIPAVPVARAEFPVLAGKHILLSAGEWCAGLRVFQTNHSLCSTADSDQHSQSLGKVPCCCGVPV